MKQQFLTALEQALRSREYPWLDQPCSRMPGNTKLDTFMINTRVMIESDRNLVNIDSASFVDAWRAIGMKGKPTYKGLRALA